MPSVEHEAAVELLHRNPQLAAVLLASAGVAVPVMASAVIADSNLSARKPVALAAEAVILLAAPATRLAVVAEVRADPGRRADYARVIRDTASEAARHALEELMKTVFRDEFIDGLLDQGRAEGEARGRAEGEAQGRAEGEAQMLLRVLDARGFSVPGHVRERVTSCTDTDQLEAWGDKAATAASLEEIFGGYSPEAGPSGT